MLELQGLRDPLLRVRGARMSRLSSLILAGAVALIVSLTVASIATHDGDRRPAECSDASATSEPDGYPDCNPPTTEDLEYMRRQAAELEAQLFDTCDDYKGAHFQAATPPTRQRCQYILDTGYGGGWRSAYRRWWNEP